MADRVLAEFADDEALARTVTALVDKGYSRIDAYLPYPSHAVEHALARRPSRLPVAIFMAGVAAAAGAYFLQWFLVGYLYPLVVGSRPPHFPLPFVIITFEMGVLFAGLTAFLGTLVLGRLVTLIDGTYGTPGFETATRDRFWLEVLVRDRKYDPERTRQLLGELGALRIEYPEGRR